MSNANFDRLRELVSQAELAVKLDRMDVNAGKPWLLSAINLLQKTVGESHVYYTSFREATDHLDDFKLDIMKDGLPILQALKSDMLKGMWSPSDDCDSSTNNGPHTSIYFRIEELLKEIIKLLKGNKL